MEACTKVYTKCKLVVLKLELITSLHMYYFYLLPNMEHTGSIKSREQ